MGYSRFTGHTIPKVSTRKTSPFTTNFAKGIYTYKPNDTMGDTEIRLAQDARFDRVGEYGTRPGYQQLSEPIGYGELIRNMGNSKWVTGSEAKTCVFTTYGVICGAEVNIRKKSADVGYVVPKVSMYYDGELVASACVDPADLDVVGIPQYVFFNNCPKAALNTDVRLSISVQSGSLDDIEVEVLSTDNQMMCILYDATEGAITSVFEANIDGDKSILFVFNRTLYWRKSNGTVSSIRTLPVGTTKVRFSQNLNTIRYVDGLEAPHLLTPTISAGKVTAWADSAIPVTDLKTGTSLSVFTRNIMNGTADNLIYFATDPDTEAIWTYPYGYTYAKSAAFSTTATISGDVGDTLTIQLSTITPSGIAIGDWITGQGTATAEVTAISGSDVDLVIVDTTPQTISSYDQFSTDFYQNFPAIKTGDPLTAMFNLGGVLYFMTRRNKYQMYAQSADSWSQSNANAQNGTFSQESVVCDLNYAYFASDNGIYIFDGSSEASLTEGSIQNVYDAIPNKESIVLDLYKNRLYVFYPSTKRGPNDHCLVYNINLRVWESFDSNTYVSATSARQNTSSRFICGHSRVGMLMLAESADNNNYSDMGQPIAFNLETAYQHYGTTSQLKRITKWRPEFATTQNPYTVECGYALDFTDQVNYAFSIDLQNQTVISTNYVWDNPSDYGVPAIPTIHTTLPRVNGEFYRCQIRYQHIAAFEPVIFRSHTLTVQTQRIR